MSLTGTLLLLVSAQICTSVLGGRVLLVPISNESHFIEFHGLGRFLRQRGHEVFVLLGAADDQLPSYAATTGYRVVRFNTTLTWTTQRHEEAAIIDLRGAMGALKRAVQAKSQQYCSHLLQAETLDTLRRLRFDVAVLDSLYVVRCNVQLAKQLGLDRVAFLGTPVETWSARLPLQPSTTEPQIGLAKHCGWLALDSVFSDASFGKRVLNTLGSMLDVWLSHRNALYLDPADESLVSLHLANRDHLLDWNVYPETPNVRLVGGLGCLPPQPLLGALRKFADDATNGLVVCTFGSMFSVLTDAIRTRLLRAFLSMRDLKFVIKLEPQVAKQTLLRLSQLDSSHIMVMERVPQNDLLAHPNTKLFITHSGNNGQFEALANGVPMIAMYLYADQIDNAERVQKRRFGVKMDVHAFTPQELVHNVRLVMGDRSFAQRIKNASSVFHSRRHPGERAAEAVELLMHFGPDFFRPAYAQQLTYVQFFNLDVYFALSALVLALLCLLCSVCRKTLLLLNACFIFIKPCSLKQCQSLSEQCAEESESSQKLQELQNAVQRNRKPGTADLFEVD